MVEEQSCSQIGIGKKLYIYFCIIYNVVLYDSTALFPWVMDSIKKVHHGTGLP